ncbi:hypothetical protein QYE76_031369 [Lolium multiflorum]|uniref:Reverse transcriptase zinc-binding domain-containing protein n=1 Tax=Lolium multiflorum TaxID=4521 RepID=A0AAD8QRN6_LOLMU|nr:hypothetical protein QYE76_031369 [Lolium multiflorum]
MVARISYHAMAGIVGVFGAGSSSNMLNDAKPWRKLWASKVPGKMKITIWRYAHNCLPCGVQLRRRGVPIRVFCGQEESVEHTLLFCCFASEVWHQAAVPCAAPAAAFHITSSCLGARFPGQVF